MKVKWIIIAYLIINIILALIPDFDVLIQSATANWNDTLRIFVRFIFDPAEYVWKWIIGLLIVVILLMRR